MEKGLIGGLLSGKVPEVPVTISLDKAARVALYGVAGTLGGSLVLYGLIQLYQNGKKSK